ncbi:MULTISPECIES: hypothetical protein [unclassified Polaribacter]|uniref:hypothetical protein n=1 Tax=unclassified Polaribacter TaxID=196858 RepID=UPI0011BF0A22|nr:MULTISPECIES: hypothetical protein [unclassified Polaribacter]TXD54234.1 hypothetical protein ES043_01670 [Polaribacter sp. IC063]TXD57124.1 hypothetical protein ES044_15790 [Polaribacter sp. IC066]
MKLKLEKILYASILFQIIATQGILVFLMFNFLGNWELKKLVHPVSFFLILLFFVFKAKKGFLITQVDIIFFGYFSLLFILLLYNASSLQSVYFAFRELFWLFILVFIFAQTELNQKQYNKVLNLIFYLVIINIVFIGLTYVLGSEKYMKLLTGRYQWGIDDDYKFKITTFYKFWRSPALIGNAASVGYFGLFAYFLMDTQVKFKYKKYFAIVLIICSFVRSVYLAIFIYEFLKFITKKKYLKIIVLVFKILIPVLILVSFFLSKYNIFSISSLSERIKLWTNNINVEYNLIFGGAIGKVGGAVRDAGFVSVLDSYWLLILLSSGFLGIIISSLFIFEKSKKTNKFLFILLGLSFAGFFVSLTQSIVFLVLFPMLFITIKENSSELDTNEDT